MRISVIALVLAMAGCAGGGAKHSQQEQDAGQAGGVTQPEGGGSGGGSGSGSGGISGGGGGGGSRGGGGGAGLPTDAGATSDASVTIDGGPIGTITVPAAHPRLWLNDPAIMARAKSWFATSKFLPDTSHTAADNPAWPAERGLYHQMTKDAADASKQAGITFCQQAIDVVKGFSFGVNSPGDDNRWYGEYFVLAYDWCSDMMSSSDRATIISNLNAAFAAFNAKD